MDPLVQDLKHECECEINENDCNIPDNRKEKPNHCTLGNVRTRGRGQKFDMKNDRNDARGPVLGASGSDRSI